MSRLSPPEVRVCCRPCKNSKRALILLILVASTSMAVVYRYHGAFSGNLTLRPHSTSLQRTGTESWAELYGNGSSTSAQSVGYVVSNAYSGQQGSGVRALLSLQCWMKSFSLPMRIVEPFIERFSLSTRLQKTELSLAMKFSDHYDLNHFNDVSKQELEPTIATWEEFRSFAPSNAIVARLHNGLSSCQVHEEPYITLEGDMRDSLKGDQWDNKLEVDNVNGKQCFKRTWLDNSLLADIEDLCVVRVVTMGRCLKLLDARSQVYPAIFGSWSPRNVTLVLRLWSADWDVIQNPVVLKQLGCRSNSIEVGHKIQPSVRLLRDAQYYTDTFLHSQNRVTVMIRSEQAIRGFKAGDRFEQLRNCMQATVALAHNLTSHSKEDGSKSKGTASRESSVLVADKNTVTNAEDKVAGMFLTLDVGKYGSKTVDSVLSLQKYNLGEKAHEVVKMVKTVVQELYHDEWPYSEWESSFHIAADGNENPGYIASLQRTIASQADCLVLLGGGDYQRQALLDYQTVHPDPSEQCVWLVCFKRTYLMTFREILRSNPHVLFGNPV